MCSKVVAAVEVGDEVDDVVLFVHHLRCDRRRGARQPEARRDAAAAAACGCVIPCFFAMRVVA